MKKTLIILLSASALLSALVFYKYKKYEDEKSLTISEIVNEPPAKVTTKAVAVEATANPPERNKALPEVLSLEQMEADFRILDTDELKKILEESKNNLIRHALIEKANAQSLSPYEKEILRAEIRKQGVLNNLIAKNKLDDIKRKHSL